MIEPAHPGLRGAILATVCAFVLSSALFAVTAPVTRENATPWPPVESGERLVIQIKTPDLEGPDPIQRAPVVAFMKGQLTLDGAPVDNRTLAEKLTTLARNFALLQPGQEFNGQFILLAESTIGIERIVAVLDVAERSGFPAPLFVFLRPQVAERPLFGRLERNRLRAAKATVIRSRATAESQATVVDVAAQVTYQALCEHVVSARNEAHPVRLLLPPQKK